MSTKTFRGDAPSVAGVFTITITGYDSATTYSVTRNGKSVSAVGITSTSGTASALQAALAASTIPEFREVTWTVANAVVTGTMATAGRAVPAFTTSVSGGTGTIGSPSSTTTSTGPNDWNVAANWSASGVPGSDDVYLTNTNVALLFNLDQNAVTLSSLTADSTFTGTLGLPLTNVFAGANNGYFEDRAAYLKIGCTTLNLGAGTGGGSARFKLDTQAVQTALNVYGTGNPAEQGLPAFLWKGTHASNTLNLQRGSMGAALFPGETATLLTVNVGSRDNPASDASLKLGSGCTLTTINQYGGTVEANASVTTWTLGLGSATVRGAAAITTLSLEKGAGTVYWESSGTIGTLVIGPGATFDARRNKVGFTVTNCTLLPGATLLDPNKRITFTNPLLLSHCSLADVTLNLGSNWSLQRS